MVEEAQGALRSTVLLRGAEGLLVKSMNSVMRRDKTDYPSPFTVPRARYLLPNLRYPW
jgi:hypothetical protein